MMVRLGGYYYMNLFSFIVIRNCSEQKVGKVRYLVFFTYIGTYILGLKYFTFKRIFVSRDRRKRLKWSERDMVG